MNTLGLIIKGTIQFVVFLWVARLISMVFFRKTLLGRITAVIWKDTWLFLRLTFRTSKRTLRCFYKSLVKADKYLNEKRKSKVKKVEKIEVNKYQKQIVNGNLNNVIDFNSAKQLRHKWNK